MMESNLETVSLSQQCALLGVNRSSYYYQARSNKMKLEIKDEIVEVFENIPIYGAAKVHQQ